MHEGMKDDAEAAHVIRVHVFISPVIGRAFGGDDSAVPQKLAFVRAAVAVVTDIPGCLAPAVQQDAKLEEALEGGLLSYGMLPAEHDDRLTRLTQQPEPLG